MTLTFKKRKDLSLSLVSVTPRTTSLKHVPSVAGQLGQGWGGTARHWNLPLLIHLVHFHLNGAWHAFVWPVPSGSAGAPQVSGCPKTAARTDMDLVLETTKGLGKP